MPTQVVNQLQPWMKILPHSDSRVASNVSGDLCLACLIILRFWNDDWNEALVVFRKIGPGSLAIGT